MKFFSHAMLLLTVTSGPLMAQIKMHEFDPDFKPSSRLQQEMQNLAAKIHGQFFQEVRFQKSVPQGSRLVYGHPKFGYFQTKPVTETLEEFRLKFIPFTYREEIEFLFERNGRYTAVAKRRFSSPFPEIATKNPITVEGKLATNFFLVNLGYWIQDDPFVVYLPSILNKWGEVVFVHIPNQGKKLSTTYWVFKQTKQGDLAALTTRRYAALERFDMNNHTLGFFEGQTASPPLVLHHDFIPDFEGDRVVSLANIGSKITDCFGAFKFLGVPPVGMVDPCIAQPIYVVGSSVVTIDLKTQTHEVRWNPFEQLSYRDHLDKSVEGVYHPTQSAGWQNFGVGLGREFLDWSSPHYNWDWTHTNSIEHVPGKGYLMSVKNLNRLLLVSEDWKKILWSVGTDAVDTFKIEKKDEFLLQHHASLLPNGNIMLFDNQTNIDRLTGAKPAPSRLLELKLGRGKATIVWQYRPEPWISAPIRGSSHAMDETVVGFFPRSRGTTDVLLEVDRKTLKERGRLIIDHGERWLGYRAEPTMSIVPDHAYRSRQLPTVR